MSGKRTDKHLPKFIELLTERGLQLSWAEYVGDSPERITAVLARAFASGDVVVSCVSADADVLNVVTAALPGLKSGAIFIDCSTISADTARLAAAQLAGQFFHAARRVEC